MTMSKNVVILLGLLATWLMVVRMNNPSSTGNSSTNSTENSVTGTDGFKGSGGSHAETQSLTEMTDNNYVQISKQNAVNTTSMYTDNTDLSPYGRSYTS